MAHPPRSTHPPPPCAAASIFFFPHAHAHARPPEPALLTTCVCSGERHAVAARPPPPLAAAAAPRRPHPHRMARQAAANSGASRPIVRLLGASIGIDVGVRCVGASASATPLPTRISTIALRAVTWAATYAISSHTHQERPARTFRLLHIVQVYRDLGAASTSTLSRLYSERISARMPLPTARAAWTAHALGPARRTLLLALSRHCTACTSPDIIVSASSVAGQPFAPRGPRGLLTHSARRAAPSCSLSRAIVLRAPLPT